MLIRGQDLGDGQFGHYIVNDFKCYANHIKFLTIYLIGVTEKKNNISCILYNEKFNHFQGYYCM
jgi:hypothetical protein